MYVCMCVCIFICVFLHNLKNCWSILKRFFLLNCLIQQESQGHFFPKVNNWPFLGNTSFLRCGCERNNQKQARYYYNYCDVDAMWMQFSMHIDAISV